MSLTYKVWRDDEEEDSARTSTADSPCEAAERVAESDHHHRDGWEWSWPVIYRVRSPQTGGQLLIVEIDREMCHEFHAVEMAELPMAPMVHALHGCRAMCSDIRLQAGLSHWPEGQTRVVFLFKRDSDNQAAERELVKQVTCERCAKRASVVIERPL